MEYLFNPRTIGVIGVSHNPRKVGRVIFRNLIHSFPGNVYGINKKGGEVEGRKLYTSIEELPELPDLVVVAIPAEPAVEEIERCYSVGIRNFILISGGFGESGREDLDERLKRLDINLIGPNCIGVYKPSMNATFLSKSRMDLPLEGDVGIISQSGAMLASMLDILSGKRGVSLAVSLGNKLIIDEVDVLAYMERDPSINVILLYLEDTRRGRELFNVLRRITPSKPVLILKGGKTETGRRAASTHTEAMMGSYDVFKGMLKQAGAIEVSSFEEMINVLLALEQPLPKGRRLLIITNGGGYGVIASDMAERMGFELPPYRKRLNLPERVSLGNPVDLTGDAPPEWFEEVINNAEGYHQILVILTPQLEGVDPTLVEVLRESPLPLYTFIPGGRYASYLRETMIKNGIPSFYSVEDALRAMQKITRYSLKRLINAK